VRAAETSAGVASAAPEVYRNNRAMCWFTKGGAAMGVGLAVLFLVGGVWNVFGTPGSFGHRMGALVGVLVGALITFFGSLELWRLGRDMEFYEVRFDADALRFRLGNEAQPVVYAFPWGEISAVRYKRVINVQYGSVDGADGSTVDWSSYSFFRPKKLARMIAERAGVQLQ
jgi:hypothetical protein